MMIEPESVFGSGGKRDERLSWWLRILRGPIFIALITSVLTLVSTVVLYRELRSDDAGVLTLFLALIQVTIMIASLGQPTMILRNYSQRSVIGYSSFRDLGNTVLVSLPLTILISGAIFSLYKQITGHMLLVFLSANLQIVILTEAQMLNAARQYTWGNSLIRLPNSLLVLPALYVLSNPDDSALASVLGMYTGVSALVALMGLLLLGKYLQRGNQPISWKERFQGIVFAFTQSSYALPEQGVIAIAGGLLSAGQLAIYGALAVFQKPFELVTSVLRTIFTTELIRQRDANRQRLNTWAWTFSIMALLLTIIFGQALLQLLYANRYLEGANLILPLAMAGLFRLVEIMPRSFIIGNAGQADLRRFISYQVMVGGVIIFLGWWLIARQGALAIAWSVALIQMGRYVVSSRMYKKVEVKALDEKDDHLSER